MSAETVPVRAPALGWDQADPAHPQSENGDLRRGRLMRKISALRVAAEERRDTKQSREM